MKKGKDFLRKYFLNKKKRIYNALKNSDSDAVINFKKVLKTIINE